MQIQIDFPEPPDLSDRDNRQENFNEWYEQLKTVVLREVEQLAAAIDGKQDKT